MTFRDITQKNLRFHIRKYASYFFVNAFVVCALFLFGSLLFNETINNDPVMQGMRIIVIMGAVVITVFAVIFLIYTGFYFVRSRGREFGVYLTLGMTHRDLSRMVIFESIFIFASAMVLGLSVGLLLGNLFFLIVSNILEISARFFQLNPWIFLFCFGTLGLTFLVQLTMIRVFIRRLSIVNIIQSTKTKDAVKQNPIVGVVSFIILVVSIMVFVSVTFHVGWIVNMPWYEVFWDMYVNLAPFSGIVTTVGIFVSLFFVIGSGIHVFRVICKKFPRFYHRNILLFSGLMHKFRAYRTVLFSITVLSGFAIFFMGFSLTLYLATHEEVEMAQPFHFTIEQRAGMNPLTEAEMRRVIEDTGAVIENMYTLPYMDSRRFLFHTEGWLADGRVWEVARTSFLVNDYAFNHFANPDTPITLNDNELLLVYSSVWPTDVNMDMEIVVEPLCEPVFSMTDWNWGSMIGWSDAEHVLWATQEPPRLYFAAENIQALNLPFANNPLRPYSAGAFVQNYAHVISHALWQELAEAEQVNHLIGINLHSGNHKKVLDALIAALSVANQLPEGTWDSHFPELYARLRPLSFYENLGIALRSNGFILFVFGFLGIVGLISVFMVLYHKFISDIDDECETIAVYKKIGLTLTECRRFIRAHLGIVFFFPLFLGGVMALLLILMLFREQPAIDTWLYFRYVLTLFGGIVLFNVGLYAALRKQFFKQVGI